MQTQERAPPPAAITGSNVSRGHRPLKLHTYGVPIQPSLTLPMYNIMWSVCMQVGEKTIMTRDLDYKQASARNKGPSGHPLASETTGAKGLTNLGYQAGSGSAPMRQCTRPMTPERILSVIISSSDPIGRWWAFLAAKISLPFSPTADVIVIMPPDDSPMTRYLVIRHHLRKPKTENLQ
jgi:hypothetical protein